MIIVSVIIIILGGLNWMSIGLLQYDYIAGFFGTQSSIFSRLIYIFIGVCTLYFIFNIIKHRGKILLFERRRKSEIKKDEILEKATNNNINDSNKNNNDLLN